MDERFNFACRTDELPRLIILKDGIIKVRDNQITAKELNFCFSCDVGADSGADKKLEEAGL